MSARAAWRLETLGFEQVFRYRPGKEDWMAAGLPIEGSKASIPRVGGVARRGVPTCRVDERVGDVSARVRATGWELCVVVNEGNIVLGRLARAELEGDVDATVEVVMEPGPVTYRPNVLADDAAHILAERHIKSVLVTTGDGELIGVFHVEDAPSAVGTSDSEPRAVG
jgi:CBS domain-containing protein